MVAGLFCRREGTLALSPTAVNVGPDVVVEIGDSCLGRITRSEQNAGRLCDHARPRRLSQRLQVVLADFLNEIATENPFARRLYRDVNNASEHCYHGLTGWRVQFGAE